MNAELITAIIRIIITLPLVAALAYFLIRYGLSRKSIIPGGKRRMRLIEQVPLGPKTSLSMVEVGGRYILIGHSENGFTVIKEMEDLPEPVLQQESEVVDWKEIRNRIKEVPVFRSVISKIQKKKDLGQETEDRRKL